MESKKINGFLSQEEYKNICLLTPIICADLLIRAKDKFLLGRRINKPAQGEWFFPGGRVFKNETLKEAIIRKAKDELGLDIADKNIYFIGIDEHFFDDSRFGGSTHNISVLYGVRFDEEPEIDFDNTQNQEFKWFSNIDGNWHPYVKSALRKAGFD